MKSSWAASVTESRVFMGVGGKKKLGYLWEGCERCAGLCKGQEERIFLRIMFRIIVTVVVVSVSAVSC